MGFYSYRCDCGKSKYVEHRVNDKPAVICTCGSKMSKEFCTNFICKGPGFPSTQMREKKFREKRSEELKRKQHLTGLSSTDSKKTKKDTKLFF